MIFNKFILNMDIRRPHSFFQYTEKAMIRYARTVCYSSQIMLI